MKYFYYLILSLTLLATACNVPRYNFYQNRDCVVEYVYQRLASDTMNKTYYYKHSYLYLNDEQYHLNLRLRQQLEEDIDKYTKLFNKNNKFTEENIDSLMSFCTGAEYLDSSILSFVRERVIIFMKNKAAKTQHSILYIPLMVIL